MFRIGYDPDFAPITFRNEQGEAGGAAIARLSAACATAGIDCVFVPVPLARQKASLENGDVDALASLGVTGERGGRLAFTRPYLTTGAAWFAPKPFDPEDVPAHTPVTTPENGPLYPLLAKRWPHLRVVPATGYDDALSKVRAGDASAAALNIDVARRMCEERHADFFQLPDRPFLEIELALACPAGGEADTLKRLSAALAME